MKKALVRRIGEAERKYVEEVLASDFSNSRNTNILRRFEDAFAKKIGTKYAIAHVNGTTTLHSALFAAGVRAGDEVITTPLTMSSPALYGRSPDMDAIMALAKKHNLIVIEDAAETFLSKYKGRMVGSLGHLSSFSLQATKHITAGEGGVVCTDDPELADRVRKFSVLGYSTVSATVGKITKDDIQNPDFERHVQLGYN